jgi:phenylalanyl-tRNA synthetase beta chain
MKVSKAWLQELVDLQVPMSEVERLLPLRTIATKEVNEQFIELDMKGYNRADLLSMRGVAQEIAAITDSPAKFDETPVTVTEIDGLSDQKTNIRVEDPTISPVYYLIKISGLQIGPSPSDWVKKLEDSGLRSINNVTDVTNLVMLEYGQPLHAFHASVVKNESIIVRPATAGETLQTLDNKQRVLEAGDIVIADPEKILGLAGIMGGKESEIPESGTVDILLEAAIFDPIQLRKTATRLGLISEASKRFYHGLTQTRLLQAVTAAISLYQSLGGIVTAAGHQGEVQDSTPTIALRQSKTDQLIGVEISPEELTGYLTSLSFTVTPQGDQYEVTVPYFRKDIEIEEDLIEEVARMYGYERIPATPLSSELPPKIDQRMFDTIHRIKTTLVDMGLTEVQTYSFLSTQVMDALHLPKSDLIKLANPISSESEYMRTMIWPNLVEAIVKNFKQGFEDIAIFEVGKVYNIENKTPREEYHISIGLMNDTTDPSAELMAMIKSLSDTLGQDLKLAKSESTHKYFHPTRIASIRKGDQQIGQLAEVHPRTLFEIGIEKRVAILEFVLY